MIALTMDVLQCSIRLCVRLEAVVAQVKGDVKEVNYLLVCFYRNSQPIVVEDMAYFFFYSCSSYNSSSKRCNLCLKEKLLIICRPDLSSLNKRNELVSSCRH